MPFTRDGSASSPFGPVKSWPHTCTNATRLVVFLRDDQAGTTAVTYNGVPMALVRDVRIAGNQYAAYDLINPPTGTFLITVTTSSTNIGAGSISYKGAPAAAFDDVQQATPTGAIAVSSNVTTKTADSWVIFFVGDRSGSAPSGQTNALAIQSPGNGASMTLFDSNGVATPVNGLFTQVATVNGTVAAIQMAFSPSTAVLLAGAAAFGLSAQASLAAGAAFAASATIRVGSAAVFASAALAGTATISVVTSRAALLAPVAFAAHSTIAILTAATFAVARFTTAPILHIGTTATLTTHTETDHAARAGIILAGQDARTRIAGLTIRDVLNDAPNTCSLVIDGTETPTCEQSLRVVLDLDAPKLLFNGALQTVNLSYEGLPEQIAYPCAAIDDTARANRMRPFGTWTNISATMVAYDLIAQFAPGFTTAHVQLDLPAVSIVLDGTEGMSGALKQVTTQIGGYFYFEDTDLHLFIEEIAATPDPIDGTPGRLLDDPPITVSRDDSQLRTRQCGRGHGEALLADVAPGETILPVANAAAWFNAVGSGHRAITLSQRLTYLGIHGGGGGSLVGPGASPTVAPGATLLAGPGLPTGVLSYGVSFVTAAGESLPGPVATITAGPVTGAPIPDPTTAPGFGTPTIGPGVDAGSHSYGVTWITAAGETVNGPQNTIAVGAVGSPVNPPTTGPTITETGSADIGWNGHYHWRVSFITAAGETTVGPSTDWTVVPARYVSIQVSGIAVGPSGTTGRHLWLTSDEGPTIAQFYIPGNATTVITFVSNADYNSKVIYGQVFPPSNTAGTYPVDYHVIPLVGLPVGPSGVTGKNVYRSVAGGGPLRLCAGMPLSNGTTTYTDTTPDGSLGAAAPSANTTPVTVNMNQAKLTGIALGPAAVTARYVYRTAANGSQLRLLQILFDNTTTTINDSAPDTSLGGNCPTVDTSGLVGTGLAGTVLPGATSVLTSGAGPFPLLGGWVFLSGNQLVRYTGIAGNTLTGIPASGVGAIVTTVLYGTQVMPAPALIGVTGVVFALPKGTPVCLWVQRDDLGAQAEQAAVDAANGIIPADGIYEGPPLVDERRNEASMTALCDANLALYARPIVTVTYACRDVKTKSGKTIVIDLDSPAIHETLTIQEVTISEIDIAPGLLPRFSVTASSVRFSLDDILRRLLTSSDAQTG